MHENLLNIINKQYIYVQWINKIAHKGTEITLFQY